MGGGDCLGGDRARRELCGRLARDGIGLLGLGLRDRREGAEAVVGEVGWADQVEAAGLAVQLELPFQVGYLVLEKYALRLGPSRTVCAAPRKY